VYLLFPLHSQIVANMDVLAVKLTVLAVGERRFAMRL
jgi:hypothetical protein